MNPVKKIVIVGGGTAGWLAAALLSHQFAAATLQIELVESATVGSIGLGESTVPPFVGLLRRLGIDEQDFMRETDATFKLGIRFVDWREARDSYFHPFGRLGGAIDGHDFYQCWLSACAQGETWALADFSPSKVMAESGRFFYPDQARDTPIGGANYAMHVDARKLADYLRRYAEARGVQHTIGQVTEVKQNDQGFITRLLLVDGRLLEGDFFIDCTGFGARLMGTTLGTPYVDWSRYLVCDRAIAVKTAPAEAPPPYTLARAQRAGWMWSIPLRQAVGHGYVYGSGFCSDDAARSTLLRSLPGQRITEPTQVSFTTGHRQLFWSKNCLALGLAAGFVEPLEATAIHLIARGLELFLRVFPDKDCQPSLQREYNRCMTADFEEVRDFVVLHYWATGRRDTPFWRWCSEMTPPDSLLERVELFRTHGHLPERGDQLFRHTSWQAVLEGMGVRPEAPGPRVRQVDSDRIRSQLNLARETLAGMVRTLPSHQDFLDELHR